MDFFYDLRQCDILNTTIKYLPKYFLQLGKCGGGMWFDQTNATKATIENAQMYQLGMKLGK